MGTFIGAQSKCCECMPLCATQHVGHTELSSADGVQCGIYGSSLALHGGTLWLAVDDANCPQSESEPTKAIQ